MPNTKYGGQTSSSDVKIRHLLAKLFGPGHLRDRPFNLQEGEGRGYGIFFRLEFFFRTT